MEIDINNIFNSSLIWGFSSTTYSKPIPIKKKFVESCGII